MKLSIHIALRYLFAKKSHNAINIISLISLGGVTVGTMALVIVLSVFNGFDSLIDSMYSGFNPDLKIAASSGRAFNMHELDMDKIKAVEGVENVAFTLETQAMVRYKEKQSPCVLKGVDEQYRSVSNLDSTIRRGEWSLSRAHHPGAIMGYLLARTIGAGVRFVDPLVIYVPKREGRLSLVNPSNNFNTEYTFPNAFFLIGQPEIDENYMILPIKTVRQLLEYENEVSSLEVKVKDGFAPQGVKRELLQLVDQHEFSIKDRREQEAGLFRMMKTEKWMTFLILSFILLIAAFNIVGTMSMLMLDKKEDMLTLRNMGAGDQLLRSIFLFEGWMVSLLGALLGLLLGGLLCLVQIKFGIISMGDGFAVDAYPIILKPFDFLIIFLTVSLVGFGVAYLPVRYINFHR